MDIKYTKNTPAEELANIFIRNLNKEDIIAEIFNFFEYSPIARCNEDPGKIDNPIKDFIDSDYSDVNTLVKIINIVKKGSENSEKQEKELVEKVKSYQLAHLTEDTNLETMAKDLHVSYHYICHIFKVQMGMSINTYKNRKRVEMAIKLLSTTELKIAEISSACGFNNTSYFAEVFTRFTGFAPKSFKDILKSKKLLDFYTLEDILLLTKMESFEFLSGDMKLINEEAFTVTDVNNPDEQSSFLHETAIIEFKNTIYTSWYQSPEAELMGYTPVVGKRSFDCGITFTEKEIIAEAEDKTDKLLYCPPVYGIDEGKLYMFINEMVAPDHIHALNLYLLDEESGKFELLWSRPIPFKLNTNVVKLSNGKLILPGRIGEIDSFPNTPALLISDSGRIDSEWRLIKIAENGDLPDGTQLIHPELSLIENDGTLYIFSRNDMRHVPLLYISKDFGESFTKVMAHDIPYVGTKIYAGTLTDGRNYVICNTDKLDRSKISVYFSEKGSIKFNKQLILFDEKNENLENVTACHYPAAVEYKNKLYIIATKNFDTFIKRGAVLFTVDLNKI
ncbi:MAG: helix-turn-helix domain-containing protein [Ruminococcaceae bacterium]|nr:helix-turn-helix domain-containing protein [Oscillospiraceae bacterium]